jgi:GAF domain-containing protein
VASDQADKDAIAFAKVSGVRTLLMVPMLKDGEVVGAIVIYRQEVRTFNDREIELLKSFAAQAVIAIENARLLNELRQRTSDLTERTTDLTEALEQQTATSEVLQVISRSAGHLEPVFASMLENAVRICDAKFGIMNFPKPSGFRPVAMHNVPEPFAEFIRRDPVVQFGSKHPLARAAATKQVVHIPDLELYADEDAVIAKFRELTGARTILHVPMLKDEQLVGIVSIYRQQVRPFADRQIDLVKNFAAQAVIAIENARLLNELRRRTTDLTERTTDLSEALERQTATSEVLQVISGSPGDLEPVFATMLEKAVRICDATFGNIYRWDGEALHLVATHNTPPAFAEARRRTPHRRDDRNRIVTGILATKAPVHVVDAAAQPGYIDRTGLAAVQSVELGGVRTFLAVPMLKEDELIGGFTVYRREVRPFTGKQIELVQNFAAQAVIAIENARLLNELRQSTKDLNEALEQQTATSEVLSIVSSSGGQLNPVFQAMLEKACRICEATCATMQFHEDGAFRLTAAHNIPPLLADARRSTRVLRPGPWHPFVEVAASKKAVHINDYLESRAYQERDPLTVQLVELGGARTVLVVPMLKDQELLGVIAIFRQVVRSFNDKQIELVQSFAAQAVIAIENAQLLNDLRERTTQLEAQSREVAELNQQLEQRVTNQVDEIERMGRLRRFLPPQVADLIVASGGEKQLESHRREITALFCDLRGFTGFTESADAEDVMALLRDYHAAVGEIIIKYNGTLERYAGDGVMVVFNDPVPVENPALQAVLMALEVREAIGALTGKWRRFGHDIGFGIGIAHGYATLGTIGFEGRFDYAAIGTVSNVASRLCDEAKPGQILISSRVLAAVENAVIVEPVGEFELKGIRRPLAAYTTAAGAP